MDDRQLFEQNFRENRSKIYHMIGHYISDAATIEDLTQHTFLKAWVKRQSFRGESSYNTWLTSIAINTALTHLQYQKIRPRSTKFDQDINTYSDGIDTLRCVITNDEFDRIFKAISSLSPTLHAPVVLNIIYGLSYDEVAQTLGIPLGTVRSRIHRARFLLKDLLR